MNCEIARTLLPLSLYDELTDQQQAALSAHLASCAVCRQALEFQRRFHQALQGRTLEPAEELLAACRRELSLRLKLASHERSRLVRWALRLSEAGARLGVIGRAAAATALLGLGFLLGRWSGAFPDRQQAPSPEQVTRIRLVQPAPNGRVQIVVEETRQRVISGRPEEEPVLGLLLAAAREAPDPGLRSESVELLGRQANQARVREALLEAMQRDPNPGVRLKALEAVKPLASQAEVRQRLARVLLEDQNPGLRVQAIDLLVQQPRQETLIGLLQGLLEREDNNYVRLRCWQALRELNASAGTF